MSGRINPGVVSRVTKKSWGWNRSWMNLSERLRQSRRTRPMLGRSSQRRVLLFLSASVHVASPTQSLLLFIDTLSLAKSREHSSTVADQNTIRPRRQVRHEPPEQEGRGHGSRQLCNDEEGNV